MKSLKKISILAVSFLLAGAAPLIAQEPLRNESAITKAREKPIKLTSHDMEVLFQEVLPPQAQQMIASNPEEKKKLVDEVKRILAVAQLAEREGYAKRPELQSQIALQTDLSLNQTYRKKNPDMKVSDDQINAYYQAHPDEFDTFMQ